MVHHGVTRGDVVRYRWAMVILASAGGNTVAVIARLVHIYEDRWVSGDPHLGCVPIEEVDRQHARRDQVLSGGPS